jgi:hypothetical protein
MAVCCLFLFVRCCSGVVGDIRVAGVVLGHGASWLARGGRFLVRSRTAAGSW